MAHLGGPELPDKIRERHERYCRGIHPGDGAMFAIVIGPENIGAGSVGYWVTEWQGQLAWEIGWMVLPEHQGQGIATRATTTAVDHVRAENSHRFLHAFPAIDNVGSNAICRKLEFTLQGEVEFDYPPGNFMRCNDWQLDLSNSGAWTSNDPA